MDERLRFVARLLGGEKMAVLCREFDISRKTGYCLEQAIRKLISETLEDAKGHDWWNSGCIPPAVVQSAAENQKKEMENGLSPRSERAIDFTNFGELSVIINHNWKEFESTLKNRAP